MFEFLFYKVYKVLTMLIGNHKLISNLLIILAIFIFCIGFYIGENSAGAGTYDGDFKNVWINLNTFLNNTILEGINLTASGDPNIYKSSRTPLIYILNKIFNPFTNTKFEFVLSVFFLSFVVPLLFYFSIRKKFKNIDISLSVLISSIILISPYFRTSAYWGLEENYGLIAVLTSFIFFQKIFYEKQKRNNIKFLYYFLLIFFSSSCVYLDQKLLIIPLISITYIIFLEEDSRYKFFSIIFYFILSLPFLYLIYIWRNIIPNVDAEVRYVGRHFYLVHPGYVISIIAFYIFPLIFFKEKKIKRVFTDFFKSRFNRNLIYIFILYLFLLVIFNAFSFDHHNYGRGIAHKLIVIFFTNTILQEIFTYIVFLISFFVVLIFFEKNKKDLIILLYFILSSIFITPIFQEYYDPLILIFIFTFFSKNFNIKYQSVYFLYFYNLFFLIGTNIYYQYLS